MRSLLDLFLPPRCGACLALGAWLCEACREGVHALKEPLCGRCGRELAFVREGCGCRTRLRNVRGIRSVAAYEGPLERAIHRFKYEGWPCLAPALTRLLVERLAVEQLPAVHVVAVPLHPDRLRARGYNQSELLAREIRRRLGVAAPAGRLGRIRATPPQVGLDRLRRFGNVAGAFRWDGPSLREQPVLLIDDVTTTGATLEACAAAVRAAGSGPVTGLTLARVGL